MWEVEQGPASSAAASLSLYTSVSNPHSNSTGSIVCLYVCIMSVPCDDIFLPLLPLWEEGGRRREPYFLYHLLYARGGERRGKEEKADNVLCINIAGRGVSVMACIYKGSEGGGGTRFHLHLTRFTSSFCAAHARALSMGIVFCVV